ncbi:MAG: hypothetical protein J5630_01925 [Bacteroidaceae bacterium]|nr:hypothetical protein [Bacteroidaceae bacterium]
MKKIFPIMAMLVLATASQAFDESKYYVINRNGETGSYMYANGSGISTGSLNKTNASYIWQLIPTGTENGYYIRNAGTGQYVQTSKLTVSTAVSMGTAQVEYIISTGAGTSTYFMASNDQGGIDYSTDNTLGLNKGASGVVAYYIKTGRGNSYWTITETDYTPDEPSTGEDEDMCLNVHAYRMPCGTYMSATKMTRIDIAGEGVLGELHYTPATKSLWTLYTNERATVMAGGKVNVTGSLAGYTTTGLVVAVCADFDGDGQFEQTAIPPVGADIAAELTVPADAKPGMGRIRIRVDQNGNTSANGDIAGTLYDLPIYIEAAKANRTVTVLVNSSGRGTVSIQGVDEEAGERMTADFERGTTVTVVANNIKGNRFTGWKQGNTIVSTDKTYTCTLSEDKTLVAMFTPKPGGAEFDDEYMTLTFLRGSGQNVTVYVTDQDDNDVEGVIANVVSVTGTKFKSWYSNDVADKTDLTPTGTSLTTVRKIRFNITGIPSDYYIEKIHSQMAALSTSGAFLTSGSNQFRMSIYTGPDDTSLALFAKIEDDLNKNPGQKTMWQFTNPDGPIVPTDPMCLEFQLVNTANSCASAIYSVTLHKSENQPTGINDIIADRSKTASTDGKYMEDNHVIVVKDGQKYLTSGQRIR